MSSTGRVPPGTPGEIVARPKKPGWMFTGYEANPAATVDGVAQPVVPHR